MEKNEKDEVTGPPLAVVRHHLIRAREVKLEDDDLVILDVNKKEIQRFPKHLATHYVSKSSKKPYDLLAVWTCYKYAALSFGEYVTKCRSEKAAMVSTVDKKDLMAYLKGDIDQSAQLISGDDTPLEEPASTSTSRHPGDPHREHKDSRDKDKDRSTAAKQAHHPKDAKHHGSSRKPGEDSKKRKLDDGVDARAGKEHKKDHHKSARTNAEIDPLDSVIKRILDKEYCHRDRTSVLNAKKKTFENVLKTAELVNAEAKEKMEKASKNSLLQPAARKDQLPLSKLIKQKIHGTPIIVVPAGFSDLFTMLNAKEFLETGVYVSNMQKKAEGCRKTQSFVVTHEEDGERFTFKVVDSVNRFSDRHWRCVVGVIVSGQAWQFKGWKWKFPLEVFKKVCGIHIYLQGSQLGEEIQKWDVKILMIHPDKRHLDKVAAKEFWRYLLEFIRLKLQ